MARKRIQVPKRIAGIPVPRQMRASPIAAFLASPGGQLILAEILLALAAVLVTAANPATKPGRYLRRAIVDGAALLHIVDSAGGSKKSPLRTAMLTVAVERAIAAFSTALSRTIPRRTAAEASGARDVTPPDAGKKRSTSRRLIRR